LLTAITFLWFPPMYLVPVLVWSGSLSTLSRRQAWRNDGRPAR
jgi:hypothetical protein